MFQTSVRRRFRSLAIVFIVFLLTLAFYNRTASVKTAESAALPPVGATKTVGFAPGGDADNDGKADPGDTLEYTITVNNGGTDATGVTITDILQGITTLVPGSVSASPIATADSFTASGNIPIAPTNGVLANDVNPVTGNNTGLTVTQVQGLPGNVGVATNTTAVGFGGVNGSATVQSNGSFTYEPPPGFTGSDTFTYRVADAGGKFNDATVTITVSNKVWFINNNAGGSLNRGTFTHPFTTIANFNTANTGAALRPAAGDIISLRTGTGTYAESDGLNLLNTQTVIGEGVQFSSFFTASTNSTSAYTTFAGTAGTAPNIATSAGNGVDLASGNTLRGFNIGNTGTGTKVMGSNFGTLTVSNLTLNGTGGALNLTNGALAATFDSISSTNSTGRGINLDTVTGSLTVTGSTSITDSAQAGIRVTNGGSSYNFGTTTLTSTVSGLELTNNATSTFTFASLAVTTDAGPGLLASSSGTLNIGGASNTIVAAGAAGLDVTSTSFGSGATFSTVSSSGNAGGKGINLDTVTGSFVATGGSITGAGGVAFDVNAGTGTINYGGTITNAAARAVEVTGRTTSTVTLSGNVSDSGTGVNIASNSSGTITLSGTYNGTTATSQIDVTGNSGTAAINFSGSSKVLSTGASNAIDLTSNGAATINFTNGGLSVTTTSGLGFNATGGGTINVTGTNNSITTTAGAAINVANTTIGASNLNFRSISSTNATTDAISLSSTGTTGGLKVGAELPGTPTAGDGGTITNPGDNAISLVTTSNNFFRGLLVNGTGGHGVVGTGMTDGSGGAEATLEFRNSRFTSPGDADNETAIFLGNILSPGNNTGSLVVADTIVEQFEENGLEVYNTSGSLTVSVTGTLTGLTDSTMKFDNNNDTHGQQGIIVTAAGTASLTFNVSGTFFNNIESAALDARAGGANAVIDVNWIGNVSRNGGGPDRFPAGGGFQIVQDVSGSATFDINNNNIRDCFCDGVVVIADGPSQGRINNNVISDTFDSGAVLGGDGIRIDTDQLLVPGPGPGNNFTATIQIQGNSIGSDGSFPGIGDDGIQILHRDGTKTLNLTIENNTIANTASEAIRYFQDADISDGGLRPYGAVRVAGNTMTNIGNPTDAFVFITQDTADLDLHVNGNTLPAAGNRNISLAQSGTSVHQITQPSVAALAAANTNSTASSTGTITFNSPVTNPPLPTNPLVGREMNLTRNFEENVSFLNSAYQTPSEMMFSLESIGKRSATTETVLNTKSVWAEAPAEADAAETNRSGFSPKIAAVLRNSSVFVSEMFDKIASSISPTVYSQTKEEANRPLSGETITINGSGSGFTIPAGNSLTVTFRATVDNGPFAAGVNNITNQATVSGTNFSNVLTNTTSVMLDAAPDLSVTKTDGGGNTQPGGTVAYTLNYANATGNNLQGATGVVLTETVPANTTFNAGASTAGWLCAPDNNAGSTCTLSVGALAAGANGSATFAVNVLGNLPAVSTVSNTSSIADDAANGADLNGANNTGNDTTPIIGVWLGTTSTDWFTATNWSNNTIPPNGNNVSVPNVANQPIITTADVTLNNLVLNGENVTLNAGRTLTVSGAVTLGSNNVDGDGTLAIGSGGSINRTTGQVNSALQKTFGGVGAFTFPVGTANGFSPVVVNVTAGTGNLTIRAVQMSQPQIIGPDRINRYWALSGSGITADLTFNYLQVDVLGDENQYRLVKVVGTIPTYFPHNPPTVVIDPTNNLATIQNVSSFSDWTLAGLGPTAANVSIGGRVLNQEGRGVGNARVEMVDQSGNISLARTNPFGFYRFYEVGVGQIYVINVRHKSYQFTPMAVTIDDARDDLNFIAGPR